MKKFYTLAVVACLAASASAQERQKAVVGVAKKLNAVETVTSLRTQPAISTLAFNSINDMAGEYAWSYYGLLNGDSGQSTGIVEIAVTQPIKGTITISGIVSAGTGLTTPIKATVDFANGTVTLPNKQDLGQDSYGDQNYFYIKTLTEDGDLTDGAYSGESIVGTINDETIVFPDEFVFAVGDPDNENLGWWKLTAFNEFTPYVEPDNSIDLADWTEFSTATMIDGWILPVLTYQDDTYVDPADFPLSVKVARNNDDENLILIENPYLADSGFPMTSGKNGYIVIDVTDPEFVIVNPGIYSGFNNGSNEVCCLNVEGFYVSQGYSKSIIQSALADITEWSTLTEEDGNAVIYVPTCRFQYTSDLTKLYTWTNREDAMKATITIVGGLSGINNIIDNSNSNAKVEYFNLQGVRVDNPAAGQLVIKRQGSEVSKIVVR